MSTGADSQHGAGAVAALAEAVGALDGAALPLARDFAREAKTQRLAESSLARRPNTVETLCILGALLPLRSNLRRTSALAVRVSAAAPSSRTCPKAAAMVAALLLGTRRGSQSKPCLFDTYDAADEEEKVGLGRRRYMKKK